jgi:hypothetical protein
MELQGIVLQAMGGYGISERILQHCLLLFWLLSQSQRKQADYAEFN